MATETLRNFPAGTVTGLRSHVRWNLIFWLFLLSGVAFLDRVNISIAGGSLASAYHLSNVQLGWVFSAFLAGYALFQTPGGRDRKSTRLNSSHLVISYAVFCLK